MPDAFRPCGKTDIEIVSSFVAQNVISSVVLKFENPEITPGGGELRHEKLSLRKSAPDLRPCRSLAHGGFEAVTHGVWTHDSPNGLTASAVRAL